LHNIRGKPLVLWVAERIAQQAPQFPLYFAVDDDLLYDCVTAAGFKAVRTRRTHPSGTDRLAEANRRIGAHFVINVQADEPLVTGAQIRMLNELISGAGEIATLATAFRTAADFLNPNQVKVVRDRKGHALYFSRSPIPHPRGVAVDDAWVQSNPCFRHLGLYAYKASFLERFTQMSHGGLEDIEKLEQLRALENGCPIACGITEDTSLGVDTPEDALRFEAVLAGPPAKG
jgi:3-deoxy-manno-octulosonate cytidylyltransferase (CMP-KDO synthetase)